MKKVKHFAGMYGELAQQMQKFFDENPDIRIKKLKYVISAGGYQHALLIYKEKPLNPMPD